MQSCNGNLHCWPPTHAEGEKKVILTHGFKCVRMSVCTRAHQCFMCARKRARVREEETCIFMCWSMWDEGGGEKRLILQEFKTKWEISVRTGHTGLSKQSSHQILQVFADILNCTTLRLYISTSDGLTRALCVTCNFPVLHTEEVMLAEENKSSGRSPLDGKLTRPRRHLLIASMCHLIDCLFVHKRTS